MQFEPSAAAGLNGDDELVHRLGVDGEGGGILYNEFEAER